MMQPLKLDYHANARPVWIGRLLLATGIIGALATGWQVMDKNRQVFEGEAQLEKISRRNFVRVDAPKKANSEAALREMKEADAVIERIVLPWESLFEAIDSIPEKDVALLDLKPDVQKGTVRVGAEAKNLESQLDYISALQKNPLFRDVTLLSHQMHDQDPQNPVRFVLVAGWRDSR